MTDRDWANSPYVRVYQSIRDDDKFRTVYNDDRALAAWVEAGGPGRHCPFTGSTFRCERKVESYGLSCWAAQDGIRERSRGGAAAAR